MNASLVLIQTDGKQREIPLKKAVQVIGRQTDCALRIPSANVSRHHCEVSVSDDGVAVRDLGSSNGTFINKERVQQASVHPGDLVSIGGLVFAVRINGKPEFIDSEDALEDGLVPTTDAAATSRPSSVTVSQPQPSAPPQRTATPKSDSPLSGDPDDSSVADFDFLDDDEEIKKQPKL
ncbi:MAG: FHA domain-containing protein [Phycisphaerae bacterium]|nr:FHA domain-containing protein [Phycisphaerae bacterium]